MNPFRNRFPAEVFGRTFRLRRRRRCALRLPKTCIIRLRRRLELAQSLKSSGYEPLRRLKQESGRIESSLQEDAVGQLPAGAGAARILEMACELLARGETHLNREKLKEAVSAWDAAHSLEMAEIQCMPSALRMAMCLALDDLAGEVLLAARQRIRAQRWVHGSVRLPGSCSAEFAEHALQLAAEMQRPELHARLVRWAENNGCRTERLVEDAHRSEADLCLRLGNLMHLKHLLDGLDWEACFEQICTADIELREDPAGVYGAMDASSRGMVREAVAQMAAALGMRELTLVRYALRLAREAACRNGAADPRATVCWYVLEDSGRDALKQACGASGRVRRRIPDAGGRRTAVLCCGAALITAAAFCAAAGSAAAVLYVLPPAWVLSQQLIAGMYPRWVKPMRLPKMKIERVPDNARTLVVLPVLLSSVQRSRDMLAHMEMLGCLEKDKNIDFLLLGDFCDALHEHAEDDEGILETVRAGIAQLNENAKRRKYFYLHRPRSYRAQDERWMGENRKRGALTALNRLLLMREGAAAGFACESGCAAELAGHYRYVVTLDADTEYLPGTLQKLIGAMLHPLNQSCVLDGKRRGYAVLQPCMQLMAEASVNEYVHVTAGAGGVDGYPVSASDFYQDMTGCGNFAGKGIYDVRAFTETTEGRLDDGAILSHDLIEGILSGAGFVNDVSFYDGCPDNLHADLKRLHRWTRGDWQLLPVLLGKLEISALNRMKMAGNLLRSLYAPALMGMFLHGIWMDDTGVFMLAMLLAFHEPILGIAHFSKRSWKHALMKLAVLPLEAGCMLDAIVRTLWRLKVSRKHLMDWTTAADAQNQGSGMRIYGRIGAVLVLPGLLRPFWAPAVLGLGALFLAGAAWADDLAAAGRDKRSILSAQHRAFLLDLARKTWHFFESTVPEEGCGLPPDNVQLDPYVGAANRTSPTNIGLYMMSCIAAEELGFISGEELLGRLRSCVSSMEKLEKWNGQLFNWYDTQALVPLRPRYVSAVDSGNLAAALLMCMHCIQKKDPELARRLQCLAEEMNLAALYDADRKLFRIGMDVENGRMSEAHYDLYASEARILSYAAMMLGQIPCEHWKHLSRACADTMGGRALVSWSGTMFEYLMPELILKSLPDTLPGNSRQAVVRCQRKYGQEMQRPWGISESGYHAFDIHLNYQYRAFGMRVLAMNGNTVQDVVAPYAAALALVQEPAAAADNLMRMCELGWSGEYGMYEAADYLHTDAASAPRVVRSHMAHHQGMILCAVCNALRDDLLAKRFMEIPQAGALRLLLQEKGIEQLRLKRRSGRIQTQRAYECTQSDYMRPGKRTQLAADCHLLHGGETTVLATARGGAFAWNGEVQLNRFSRDLQLENEGMYVHLEDINSGRETVIGSGGRVRFDAGCADYIEDFSGVRASMRLCVSPEDGSVYQKLEFENTGDEDSALYVSGVLAVALASEADMRAHASFQNLFVESSSPQKNVLMFRRRSRNSEQELPVLVYLVSADCEAECETSYENLVGRCGSLGRAGGIADAFTGETGCVINPCAALRVRLNLKPGEKRKMHFGLGLVPAEYAEERIQNMQHPEAAGRASELGSTQMRAMLSHAGIDAALFKLLQRCSAVLFDAKLRCKLLSESRACSGIPRSALWRAGISGDLPVLLVEIGGEGSLDCVRDAIRMHAFYRMMGVRMDLVIINSHGSDYRQPERDAVSDVIASCHLASALSVPGGVYMLEKHSMEEETLAAVRRTAALRLDDAQDAGVQLRAQLDELHLGQAQALVPMKPVPMNLPENLRFANGYGGFEGNAYVIGLCGGMLPPAPWCNILADGDTGAVVSERGGGFAWNGNSRSGRLTAFTNDTLREGWGWMFYLVDETQNSWTRLLPGDRPMTDFIVRYEPGSAAWQGKAGDAAFEVRMIADRSGLRFEIRLENTGTRTMHLQLAGFVDWLMGTDATDVSVLRTWSRFGGCFASGAMDGVGCFAADDPQARAGCDRQRLFLGGDIMQPRGLRNLDLTRGGWTVYVPMNLRKGEVRFCRFLLGWAEDVNGAYALTRDFRSGGALRRSSEDWAERLDRLRIETPDSAVNVLSNGFLQAQVLNSRIRARTGLYQPGGAYGFRDQLQDMLPMIYYEPRLVREHLLRCAARQFEDGDVLHWWHEPYTGVRTRISDDLLFLPWVTAQYVKITGDTGVLEEKAAYLKEIEIPEGQEDVYASMQPSEHFASLHDHCMRAFRRADRMGEHGLCLMGSGDWNDGMNRVGNLGRGESIWLSEFLAACAKEYGEIAPLQEDRAWLAALNKRLLTALETSAWDGDRYLRAYTDEGKKLGGRESGCCRIDAISQVWAVLAGLDRDRSRLAMETAWDALADEEGKLIRLLDPPFDGKELDPGYIAAYPPGVRENGAQYTHAACWMLLALIELGDAQRAHRALEMLLPVNHALSEAQADVYRAEPYVMSADIYTNTQHYGRGGWSWYTGSAAWMLMAVLKLLGYERRGDRVRMNALLGDWEEASVTLRCGLSIYRLVCRRGVKHVELDGSMVDAKDICLRDDGRNHTALFPPRESNTGNIPEDEYI